MIINLLLAAVIELSGVTGSVLRARAFFDANNVKVGDPLVLTIDFLGEADFAALHPPLLAKTLDRRDWKLDDQSAKTDTFSDARRLTYRVRPMREGVLYFPALEFGYQTASGMRSVKTNLIPVHAKGTAQVVVEELGEADEKGFPKPPELLRETAAKLDTDEAFRWRKALSHPTADAFTAFAFPEARFNEATAAIKEGNWARALKLYYNLEWRWGQTEAIERGLLAALALKYDNPSVELPVWRTVGRPLLKFAWLGRLSIVVGGVFALVLSLFILRRLIRALAAMVIVIAVVLPTMAEETVEETVITNANGSVTRRVVRRSGNGSSSFTMTSSTTTGGNGGAFPGFKGMDSMFDDDFFASPFGSRRQRSEVKVAATVAADREAAEVGENFMLVLTLEMPRKYRTGDIRMQFEERPGLVQTGRPYRLDEVIAENPTNKLCRYAFPYRSLQPLTRPIKYTLSTEIPLGGFGFFAQAQPITAQGEVKNFTVKPLPAAGKTDDFSGIVSEGLSLVELPDLLKVETNDVITITYKLRAKGYVPGDYLPKDAAFEWVRHPATDGMSVEIEYKRYFVADGAAETPTLEICYYDSKRKTYRKIKSGGTKIKYTSSH